MSRIIVDGYRFHEIIPEIIPLCNRLGIDYHNSPEIVIEFGKGPNWDREHYFSDEFKAFCRATGIPHDLRTKTIKITIRPNELPLVEHTYVMIKEPETQADQFVVAHNFPESQPCPTTA